MEKGKEMRMGRRWLDREGDRDAGNGEKIKRYTERETEKVK